MNGKKPWDLSTTHSLEGWAEWMRKKSGALLVLVIRPEDVALAVEPAIRMQDVLGMVEAAMPELVDSVTRQRAGAARTGSGGRK